MRHLARTLSTTVRSLARQPQVTGPAVLTLALGIGALTALFAYLAAMLWPRLEIRDAERLVWVYSGTAEEPRQSTSYPDVMELLRRQSAVSELAAYSPFGSSVGLAEQTTYAWGQFVSGGYFSFVDAAPAAGRLLGPEDDRPEAPLVAVVSHRFWKGALGGDPHAVGHTVRLNGLPVTLVGVIPEGFTGLGLSASIYVPLVHADRISGLERIEKRDLRWVYLAGRLAPGLSQPAAQAAMDQLARALDETAPLAEGKRRISLVAAGQYDPTPGEGGDPYLASAQILMAAAGLFLLLGCASIANLLLARATARQREWAIRAALGAGRLRLAGSVLLESLLLCLAGAAAGLPCAALLARRIDSFVVTPLPGFGNWGEGMTLVRLDARSILFACGTALACALLGGLAPVLRMMRRDLLDPLKSDAAGSGTAAGALNARRLLVVAQVALSVVLLLDGGLLVRSLQGAQSLDPGFSPDRLLLASFYLPRSAGAGKGTALYTRILDEARTIPGVTAATLTQVAPLSGVSRDMQVAPREKPQARIQITYNMVAPDFFATVGIPVLQGRPLDRRDRVDAAPAVVVNGMLARKLWGTTTNVLGRQIEVAEPPKPGEPGPVFEVVGVTADVRSVSPVKPAEPQIYFSHEQRSAARMTVAVRTSGPPLAAAGGLRRALRAVHPDLSVIEMMSCRDQLDRVLVLPRMYAEVAGLFGLLGLAVAMVGLFGLLSYSVSLRGREMGIRMAVGARPRDVRRLVVRQGMALVAAGIALGVALALSSARLLASLLFGVGAADPLTYILVPAVLTLVAFFACDLPARRAAGFDPARVLRSQ